MNLRDEARCLAEALMERPEAERILFLAHLNRWLEIMEGAPRLDARAGFTDASLGG